MTREEKIKAIISKIKYWNSLYLEPWKCIDYARSSIMIWDVLDYIDNNLFYYQVDIDRFERDLWELHLNIMSLYNHFIWNYRNPIEKLDDSWIDFIYNLLHN